MITVSDELKAAFLTGNQKHLVLTFSDGTQQVDEDIYLESMEIEQSLCEEEQLTYGTTSAASFKIRILNSGKKFKGLGVSVSISTIGDDDIEYTASLGQYKVYEDTMSDDRNYRDLMCYDEFHGILDAEYADWYNALSFPMTMKQFRDAFFTHVGLTQKTAVLACDNIEIPANTVDSISGATIIQSICEPSGAFCFIDYDNQIQYVVFGAKAGLFPREDLYPASDLYPRVAFDDFFSGEEEDAAPVRDGTVYGDYDCHRITQVTVARSSEKEYVTVGESGNTYQFATNPLLMYMDTESLERIGQIFLSIVGEIVYKPAKVKGRARVWIQPGDMMGVMTQSDKLVFPILHREMCGITALYDTYEANGKEYYEYDANSLEARMSVAEDSIKDTNDSIEDIHDEIDGVVIDFQRTVDGLESKVAESQKEWDTTGYTVSAYGYGSPTSEGLAPADYANRYYLNQTNGYLYFSNGNTWSITKYCTSIQVALQSQITQTSNQIALKVSKGDVSSQLSIEDKQITLSSGRLIINSGNFQLDSSGNATATNFKAKNIFQLINGGEEVWLTTPQSGALGIETSYHSWGGLYCGTIRCQGDIYAKYGSYLNLVATQRWVLDQGYSKGTATIYWSDVQNKPSNLAYSPTSGSYCCTNQSGSHSGYSGGSYDKIGEAIGSMKNYCNDHFETKSDRRLKTNIVPLKDITDAYMELNPVSFYFDSSINHISKKQQYGLIAQDLNETFTKHGLGDNGIVKINTISSENDDKGAIEKLVGGDKYYVVDYNNFHAFHIQMIQNQQRRIEELEKRIAVLEGGK